MNPDVGWAGSVLGNRSKDDQLSARTETTRFEFKGQSNRVSKWRESLWGQRASLPSVLLGVEKCIGMQLGGRVDRVQGARVFLGVLTHPGSRYSLSAIESFSRSLAKAGVEVNSAICDENLAVREETKISRRLALRTEYKYLALKLRWYTRLSNYSMRAQRVIDSLYSAVTAARALFSIRGFRAKQKSMIRLQNITLGHAALWEQALASNSEWVVILEDDAAPLELSTTHGNLIKLMDFLAQSNLTSQSVYCDLSLSFSRPALGVEVEDQPLLEIGEQSLHEVSRPFTNTLCAVLMSRPMLEDLVGAVKQYVASPSLGFLPIDWLVNKYLLDSIGENRKTAYFFNLEPGLFIQESLK